MWPSREVMATRMDGVRARRGLYLDNVTFRPLVPGGGSGMHFRAPSWSWLAGLSHQTPTWGSWRRA